MKHVLIATILLSASLSFAGASIDDATEVGAKVILRQIANPKHFGKDSLRAVRALLTRTTAGGLKSTVATMECEPALGSEDCLIKISVIDSNRPAGFQDISFDVMVKIHEGRVVGGGPVKLEN